MIASLKKQTWRDPAKNDSRQTMMRLSYAIALNAGTATFAGSSVGT